MPCTLWARDAIRFSNSRCFIKVNKSSIGASQAAVTSESFSVGVKSTFQEDKDKKHKSNINSFYHTQFYSSQATIWLSCDRRMPDSKLRLNLHPYGYLSFCTVRPLVDAYTPFLWFNFFCQSAFVTERYNNAWDTFYVVDFA